MYNKQVGSKYILVFIYHHINNQTKATAESVHNWYIGQEAFILIVLERQFHILVKRRSVIFCITRSVVYKENSLS